MAGDRPQRKVALRSQRRHCICETFPVRAFMNAALSQHASHFGHVSTDPGLN